MLQVICTAKFNTNPHRFEGQISLWYTCNDKTSCVKAWVCGSSVGSVAHYST